MQQEPLGVVDPELPKPSEDRGVVDELRHCRQTECLGDVDEAAHRDVVEGVVEQALNELTVDLENVDLELPKGVTGRQTARVLQRQQMELAYRGVPEDEIAQQIAEAREGSEEEAIRQLKLFFILDKAAKDLEVEVNENEINGRIAMMAQQQGRRPEKLRQEMHKRGQIEQLYLQVREQKVMDQIIEKASITEVEATGDDKPEAKKKTTKKKTTKKKTTKKKAD